MKNVLIILVALLLCTINLRAQYTEWDNDGASQSSDLYKTIYFEGTISGTDTLVSSTFNFTEYSPYLFGVLQLNADSSTGKPKITIIRKYTYFVGSTPLSETLFTSDSLETQQTFADTVRGTNTFYIFGTGTNPRDTKVKLLYIAEPK
jgi:hypothetical protein